MVSVIAHELEETNTDPNLNAWYDSNGSEDAENAPGHSGQIKPRTRTAHITI